MYRFLRRLFSETVADSLMVIWYVLLLLLVVLCFRLSPGEFRYINI